jgi:predicted dehydrogenase
MIRLGIVGCGDVAFRTYFPGLKPLLESGEATVAVCFDPVAERAERAAALFPGARAATSLAEVVAFPDLDAALNLTPAPFHRDTSMSSPRSRLRPPWKRARS